MIPCMKMKEKFMFVALVLLPLSLAGMAFSYFTGMLNAMFFWMGLAFLSFLAIGVLHDPHKQRVTGRA